MIDFKQFEIYFKGLGLGEHQFEYCIGKWFFEKFDYSDIRKADLNVDVTLLKETRMLTLEINCEGTVTLLCDRCLDDYEQPLDFSEELFVKFGTEPQELDDDILVIHENDHMLNISQLIYEYVILNLPMRRVHLETNGTPACDESVTSYISKDVKQTEFVNSVWEKLKKEDSTNN